MVQIKKLTYIIDAYNAINLMKFFKKHVEWDMAEKREKFLNLIINVSYQTGNRYIIVFDGIAPSGAKLSYGEDINVVFSGSSIADSVIERMSFNENSRLMHVVSSDNQVVSICRNRGAKISSIKEFEASIDRLNERSGVEFIKEKGGSVDLTGIRIADKLSDSVISKLNNFKKKQEIEHAKAAEKRKQEMIEAEKRTRYERENREAADEFESMFGGAGSRKITSKYVEFDDEISETKENAVTKKNGQKNSKKGDNSAIDAVKGNQTGRFTKKNANEENFDWTKHIDDSFQKSGRKR
ncbi:MAG: NYN domain-containing protein [Candidatus Wallbacteria bacterium]